MINSQDEENPAAPSCIMSISYRLQCIRLWFVHCVWPVVSLSTLAMLDILVKPMRKIRSKVRLYNSTWLDTTFAISYGIAVSMDPLFFYIPTINEEKKCLQMDTKLRTVSLVFRSFTDIIAILHIIYHNCNATEARKIWRSLAIDFLVILPVPQVLILLVFYKKQGFEYLNHSKIWNALLLIQYPIRIYRLCRTFNKLHEKMDMGLLVKVASNLFLWLVTCHILGASWFFFSIQREMLCWHQTCVKHRTCGINFFCNDNISRNITKLVELCPMNPPNSTVFDFGIFVNPLESSSRTPLSFSTKFSYSFWWGLRNMSNFGTNLVTSIYLWENWFASLISVMSLLLFVYLIGNNVQTYMQVQTNKAEEEAERIRSEAERMRQKHLNQERWIIWWMDLLEFPLTLREVINTKLEEAWQEKIEFNLDNVSSILALLPPDDHQFVRPIVCVYMLRNMPVLLDISSNALRDISFHMDLVWYLENDLIVKMDNPLDRMVFITEGTVGIYTASSGSSPSAIIQGSLEECKVYGHEQLLRWVDSTRANLDSLPTSNETVKCHTRVEAFVLTASILKRELLTSGIIQDNGEGFSNLRWPTSTVSSFRRRGRIVKPSLDTDPSNYKGL